MKKIKHFILPKQYNELYTKEAISSISLTRDVADKINELIDSYNNLSDDDLVWKHEIEGTVRKAIIYIKDHLLNTLYDMAEMYKQDGFFEKYVKEYMNGLENQLNTIISGNVEDAELLDVRYGANGYTYSTAGESVRQQINDIYQLIDTLYEGDSNVYSVPLKWNYSGNANEGRFDSNPIAISKYGCSVRVTKYLIESINNVDYQLMAKVLIGKIVKGIFVEDAEMTAKYSAGVYATRLFYIPYIKGYAIKVSASFIGNGVSLLSIGNYNQYISMLDCVKVYTGETGNNNKLLGFTPVTARKTEDEQYYKADWSLNGLTWKYQALASPLPLNYVKRVTCNPNLWIGAKIYKFDQATRTTEFVETVNYNDTHPCFGTECEIDFSKYDNNYFAMLFVGKVPLYEDYEKETFGTSKGTNDVLMVGLDYSEVEKGIHIEWSSEGVLNRGIDGLSLPVQKNIELLKSIKVNKPSARFGNDTSQTWYHMFNKKEFAGVFYGGGYQAGTFFYHVSPVSYYTALLNPNSVAYGDANTEESGYRYGIVCSNFTALLHGHPIPRSTFDFRYNDVEGFTIDKFNLNTDIPKLKLYDVLTQGSGHTGHCVLLTDILNVDNSITALKVLEASTPTTRENIFFLHNGLDHYKTNPEEWFAEAYDYIAISKPEYDKTIFNQADWNIPYFEPQKVMCSRGYNSIYLEGKHKVILSIAEDVTNILINKSGFTVQNIDLTGLSMTKKNGYNLLDITEYISPGKFTITNNIDDSVEEFNVINVDNYSVNVDVEGDNLKISTSNNLDVKYINVIYRSLDDPDEKGANMCYMPRFENGVMTVPKTIVTDDNGTWSVQDDKIGDSVNAIFNSDYDTNTFFVDAEGDYGC